MISILITSFKEPKTIGRAVKAFKAQRIKEKHEIVVSAPDEETLSEARKAGARIIKDPGKGKPAALNYTFKRLKGEIIILSDGDVYSGNKGIANLLEHFKNEKTGAVSGRVCSLNDKNTMFGYWAYVLSESVHDLKSRKLAEGENVDCSGYLYAIRRKLFRKMPENMLADDAYITQDIIKQGYKTVYEPKAEVYVKYPDNLPEWISQKKRTAGRFYQLNKVFRVSKETQFFDEFRTALGSIFYIRKIRHTFWFMFLSIMRAYIWFRVFFDFRLWNREFKKTWQRVESTKR